MAAQPCEYIKNKKNYVFYMDLFPFTTKQYNTWHTHNNYMLTWDTRIRKKQGTRNFSKDVQEEGKKGTSSHSSNLGTFCKLLRKA